MKTIPFHDLDDLQDNNAIDAVDGTVVKLFPVLPAKGKTKPALQNGFIKDENGNEHRITFVGDKVQDESVVGRRIKISSRSGGKGLTGVKMRIDTGKDGTEYRKIWVTSTAGIEHVGSRAAQNGGAAEKPAASEAAMDANAKVGDLDTAETRIILYKRMFEQVCLAFGHDPVATFRQLSPSDLKEITTGQAMSWKGQYGVYARPVFGGSLQPQAPEPVANDEPHDDTVRDPKTQKTPAELYASDPDRYSTLAKWAIEKDPAPGSPAQRLKGAMLDHLLEDGDPHSLIIDAVGESALSDHAGGEAAFSRAVRDNHQTSVAEASNAQAIAIYSNIHNLISEAETILDNEPGEEIPE